MNLPVVLWILRPQFNPIIERICIVLEEDPPELNFVFTVLQARAITNRLVHIIRHKFFFILIWELEETKCGGKCSI